MAERAVTGTGRSIRVRSREHRLAAAAGRLFPGLDTKADLLRIEITRAHAELRWSLSGGLQHPVERRHRAVVKIGRRRPHAVQGTHAIVDFPGVAGIGAIFARA